MAAPNQLILSGVTVINNANDHIGRNFFASGGYSITGGSSVINKDSIVTNGLTINGALIATLGTFNNALTSGGSLNVVGPTSLATLTAGTTTFNSTVTIGSIVLANSRAKVGNTNVDDNAVTSPYAAFNNVNVPGNITTGSVTTSYHSQNGDMWMMSGSHYYKSSTSIFWRNGSNTQNAVQLTFSSGLFYCNLLNNDGSFKGTLWRISAGEGATDPNLSIGFSTTINGNFTGTGTATFGGALNASGAATVAGNLTVNSASYLQSLDVANVNMRNTSRVMNASNPVSGTMFYGNGDKSLSWDGANWVARGGAFYVSNIVSEGSLTNVGYAGFQSNVGVAGNLAVQGENYGTRVRSGGEIKSESGNIRSRGMDGNANAGRYWFGDSDAAITYDGGSFQFNRNILMYNQDIYVAALVSRAPLYVRQSNSANDRRGLIYFGLNNEYLMNYDGGNTMNFSHNMNVALDIRAGNFITSGDVSNNRTYTNLLQSAGNVTGAYMYSSGNITAAGTFTGANLNCSSNIDTNTFSANAVNSRGDVSAQHLLYAYGGARFRGGETWIDNGGNYSRIVVGSGRGWIDWDGGKFAINGSVYTNQQFYAETEIYAYGRLRAGRWGGGNFSIDVFGDGSGGGIINTVNGNLRLQYVTLDNLIITSQRISTPTGRLYTDHLSTLSIDTQNNNINAGSGTVTAQVLDIRDYARILGSVETGTASDGKPIFSFQGDGSNGIINTNSQAIFFQNAYAFGFYNRSDERLKNITEFMSDGEALDKVTRFKPIRFSWKDKKMGTFEYYGFSAQQIESVDNMLVMDHTSEDAIKHVSSLEMLPLLVASIKELKREIEELKTKA